LISGVVDAGKINGQNEGDKRAGPPGERGRPSEYRLLHLAFSKRRGEGGGQRGRSPEGWSREIIAQEAQPSRGRWNARLYDSASGSKGDFAKVNRSGREVSDRIERRLRSKHPLLEQVSRGKKEIEGREDENIQSAVFTGSRGGY